MNTKSTKAQARACYDNYFGVLRCLNGGTRAENERSADACRTELRKYVDQADALLKNPSKLLREDAWLMRALSEDIPNNFAGFNQRYPSLIESAAQAVEEIAEDELERTAAANKAQHTPGPWELKQGELGMKIVDGICMVFGAGKIPTANATLIAAAPDYHEAATEIWKAWHAVPFNQQRMTKAVSALAPIQARAEGKQP